MTRSIKAQATGSRDDTLRNAFKPAASPHGAPGKHYPHPQTAETWKHSRSAVLPASLPEVKLIAHGAHALICSAP